MTLGGYTEEFRAPPVVLKHLVTGTGIDVEISVRSERNRATIDEFAGCGGSDEFIHEFPGLSVEAKHSSLIAEPHVEVAVRAIGDSIGVGQAVAGGEDALERSCHGVVPQYVVGKAG